MIVSSEAETVTSQIKWPQTIVKNPSFSPNDFSCVASVVWKTNFPPKKYIYLVSDCSRTYTEGGKKEKDT